MLPSSPNPAVKIVGVLIALVVLGIGAYLYFSREAPPAPEVLAPEEQGPVRKVIGSSVEDRPIEAYTFGGGEYHVLFVGGIHGGYEWNSVLLAYELMDYLTEHPEAVPENVTISVIPSANPDGVFKVTGTEGRFARSEVNEAAATGEARFNANGVDLNRNFDCKWQPTSTWRGAAVPAGTKPFSEPEAKALRDFVLAEDPDAALFFHSQANAVYASECETGILPETRVLMDTYAKAAGYPAVDVFDAYPITGDVEGWLASLGIPALTIELATHESLEWDKNLAGVRALFQYYAGK